MMISFQRESARDSQEETGGEGTFELTIDLNSKGAVAWEERERPDINFSVSS